MLFLIESCLCDSERIYMLRSQNGQVIYSSKSSISIANKLKDLFDPLESVKDN